MICERTFIVVVRNFMIDCVFSISFHCGEPLRVFPRRCLSFVGSSMRHLEGETSEFLYLI